MNRAAGLGLATKAIEPANVDETACWFAQARFDVVHVHAGIGWEGHELAYAARRANVPVLIRTEHLPYLLTNPAQRAEHANGIRLIDRLICVSAGSALTHRRAGIDPEKVVAIPNGIMRVPPKRSRLAVRSELGLAGASVMLMVARFAEQKCHLLLLDAMSDVVAAIPDVILLLAGDGPLSVTVARQIAARGLAASVRILGPRGDVPDLMAAADLLVLPSSFEGLPLVILEAMAAGLPVVATAAEGTLEAVAHERTGWLSPVNDARGLAAAIVQALADPARLVAFGKASRRRYEERFQAARMVEDTAALYAAARAVAATAREIA